MNLTQRIFSLLVIVACFILIGCEDSSGATREVPVKEGQVTTPGANSAVQNNPNLPPQAKDALKGVVPPAGQSSGAPATK